MHFPAKPKAHIAAIVTFPIEMFGEYVKIIRENVHVCRKSVYACHRVVKSWTTTGYVLVAVGDLGQFFDGSGLNVLQAVDHSLHVDQLAAVSPVPGVMDRAAAHTDAVAR